MAAEKEESGAGEMVDVVLYLFVLGPAVEWCLKSPRVNGSRPGSRRGIALAIGLLALVAAAKLALELGQRQPNYFEVLGVRVDATPTEIKKAYKAISLKYHPDKSDDPDAHSKYMRFQGAYEVCRPARIGLGPAPASHPVALPAPGAQGQVDARRVQQVRPHAVCARRLWRAHADRHLLHHLARASPPRPPRRALRAHRAALPAHRAAPFAPFPRALSPPRHVG